MCTIKILSSIQNYINTFYNLIMLLIITIIIYHGLNIIISQATHRCNVNHNTKKVTF